MFTNIDFHQETCFYLICIKQLKKEIINNFSMHSYLSINYIIKQ